MKGQAPGRRQLKLGVQDLSGTDLGTIAAFVRIGRERLHCDWEIVFDGVAHVLLVGDNPDTSPSMLESPLATLRLVDAQAGRRAERGTLLRPLQYESFIEALSEVERWVTRQLTAPGAPASVVLATPTHAFALSPDARFRLRRWPPPAALQEHRYHLRLASFLSARHVGLDELVRLSNVGRPQCEEFLVVLARAGILDVKRTDATSAAPPAPAPQASAQTPYPPLSGTGLFGRIRRGLGMP